MGLELDHVFCFCSAHLPEVAPLEAAGFVLTAGTKHRGQGTANRSVVFRQNYLELIYLESPEEAQANPLQLQVRAQWQRTGSSPFGIALRGDIPAQDESQFWEYHPPYNPSRVIRIHKFNEQHPELPLLFVMPSPRVSDPNACLADFKAHRTGSTNLLQVDIQTPAPVWPLSTPIVGVSVKRGTHHMEARLDGILPQSLPLNELLCLSAIRP